MDKNLSHIDLKYSSDGCSKVLRDTSKSSFNFSISVFKIAFSLCSLDFRGVEELRTFSVWVSTGEHKGGVTNVD